MYATELANDTLTVEEWEELQQIHFLLKPFHQLTKQLEGNAVAGHHGSIWEALPAIELLLDHLERQKRIYKENSFLATSVNLAWDKLQEYYKMMDDTPIYAAGLFLHPSYRWDYFKKHWTTTTLRAYLRPTQTNIRRLWEEEYQDTLDSTVTDGLDSGEKEHEDDILTSFLRKGLLHTTTDEFQAYFSAPTTAILPDSNLFTWWSNSGSPRLTQMAFDILSIPAMSSETERVFSGTKLTISPTRNCLGEDIIEATECLNRWYKADLW